MNEFKKIKKQQEKLDNNYFHSLKIKDKKIYLDDFELKGVTNYKIKSSPSDLEQISEAELLITLDVGSLDITID